MPDPAIPLSPSPPPALRSSPWAWDDVHARLREARAAIDAAGPASRSTEILRRRAAELARPPDPANGAGTGPEIDCLVF